MRKTCLSISALAISMIVLAPVLANARGTSHRYHARHFGHHAQIHHRHHGL